MYVCPDWLSLAGLVMVLGLVSAGGPPDESLIGPQNGTMVYASKKGASMRVLRQLPPPVSPTPTPTPASATVSSTATPAPTSPATSGPPPTTGEILVCFTELREVDADGVKVKQSSGVERAFSSFATQDFNVTKASTLMIPGSQPPIPADTLTLELNLPSPLSGSFKLVASLTKGNGSVTSGDEVMTLTAGQLELSFEIDDWQWCDSQCPSSKPSMFLEVDVGVTLPAGRTAKAEDNQSYGRPNRYSLGEGAWTDFSTRVSVDHSWRNLTSGYPKLSTSSSKNILTIRLQRFNSSAAYNMAFDPGFKPTNPRGDVSCATALGDVTVHLFAAVAMVATGLGLFA